MATSKEISEYDQVNADNPGWVENMDRSEVNDEARVLVGALRRWYEDAEWVNLLEENGTAYSLTRVSGTVFRVSTATSDPDPTSKFPVGSWVKLTGTGASPTSIYARVDTVGAWSGTQTDITIADFKDASDFSSEASIPSYSSLDQVDCYIGRTIKEAAFHPVGTTTGQTPTEIPDIDSLSTVVTKTEGAGGGIDADKLDNKEGSVYEGLAREGRLNDVVNGDFSVWQDGTSPTGLSDGAYFADQIIHLTAGTGADASRQDVTSEVPSRYFARLTANSTGDKFALFGIVEGKDAWRYRNAATATLSFYARSTVGPIGDLRAGVLEWTGTEDTFGASLDPISAWNAEGADPTLSSNWSVATAWEAKTPTASWQRFEVDGVTISTSAKNVAWMIIIDDTTHSISDSIDIACVQLEPYSEKSDFIHTPIEQNVSACERFYQKTYELDTAPGTASTAGQLDHPFSRQTNANLNTVVFHWGFQTRMRTTPSGTIYAPGTGTSGSVTGASSGDLAASVQNPGERGVSALVTADPGQEALTAHFVASARWA